MERLVISVIAVIGLHTAFVLYMAGVKPADQHTAAVRSVPAETAPAPTIINSAEDTELQASVTPSAEEHARTTPAAGHIEHPKSRTPRVNSIPRLDVKDRRRPAAAAGFAKPVRDSAVRASLKPGSERTFGDHVVIYRTDFSPPARSYAAVSSRIDDDDNHSRKSRKSSVVSKLQLVYKKPWDLIKAIGSKLR